MIDFARARRAMVDNQVRTSSITDRRLLAAMMAVERERFVPASRQPLAYFDEAHDLGNGRSVASPATLARLLQLADIDSGETVLEVGTGTGYGAAVLAQLAGRVVALEDDRGLAAAARANLSGLDNVVVREGPLAEGAAADGPFDVIVVGGALAAPPEALIAQLREGGRLVVVLRRGPTAVANVLVRAGGNVAARAEFDSNLAAFPAPRPRDEFVF